MDKNEVIEQARRFYAVELEKQEIAKREREKENLKYHEDLALKLNEIFGEVKVVKFEDFHLLDICGYLFHAFGKSYELRFIGHKDFKSWFPLEDASGSLTKLGKVLHENPQPESVIYKFGDEEYFYVDSMFFKAKEEGEKRAQAEYIKRMAENIEFSFPQTSTVSLKDAACGQIPEEIGQPEEFVGKGDFKVGVGDSRKHGLYYNEFCDGGPKSAKEKE